MSSFGSALGPGAAQALAQSMQSRGVNPTPVLNQVSPGAPTFNPNMQPQQAQPGNPGVMAGMGQPPQGQPMPPQGAPQPLPPGVGGPMGDPENQLIIKALSAKLASNAKIAESQSIPPPPPNIPGMV